MVMKVTKKVVFIIFCAIACTAIWLFQDLLVRNPHTNTANSFKVLTLNVGNSAGIVASPENVASFIKNCSTPDIVFAQEVMHVNRFVDACATEIGLKYHASGPLSDSSRSLILLSKFELSEPDYLIFKARKMLASAVGALATIHGEKVYLCAVHLDPTEKKRDSRDNLVTFSFWEGAKQLFDEIFNDNPRSESVDELLNWLEEKRCDRIIVGGDFNTVLPSKAIRKMSGEFEDALWGSPDFFKGTYWKIRAPFIPRVDYIFYSQTIRKLSSRVISNSIGDHYPVCSEFEI